MAIELSLNAFSSRPISGGIDPLAVQPSVKLCAQVFKATRSDDYSPIAMRLFRESRIHDSIVAFYQFWRCPSDEGFNGLNPMVEDLNLLRPFDRALRAGAEGQYREGVEQLELIAKRASNFLEARLMLGVFQYAEGFQPVAIRTWRDALQSAYFPMPPDFPKPYPVQSGMQELMEIATGRSKGSFTR